MKRFTETEKWSDLWFRDLKPGLKLAWIFLLDRCDDAGVWEPDWRGLRFCTGMEVDEVEVLQAFKDRVFVLPTGRWWIRKFITYQWKQFNREIRPQQAMWRALDRHGITIEEAESGRLSSEEPDPEIVTDHKEDRLPGLLPDTYGIGKPENLHTLKVRRGKGKASEEEGSGERKPASPAVKSTGKKSLTGKTDLQRHVEGWFHRRPGTTWDRKEIAAWEANRVPITETSPEELALLDWWFALPAGSTCRRHGLEALLNNWNTEIGRASDHKATTDNGGSRTGGGFRFTAVKSLPPINPRFSLEAAAARTLKAMEEKEANEQNPVS